MKLLIILLIIISIIIIILLNNKNKNIPKVIYLSYKTKDIPDYIIPNIKKIYPDYEIKLYDNNDCINFLKKEYDQEHVDIFNYLKDGPIKADFWRICILYKYGGLYFDLDIEHIKNIDEIIDNNTSFITTITEPSFKYLFNPAIIKTHMNNNVLKKCINKYIEKYRNKEEYEYWKYSIVYIMGNILFSIIKTKNIKDGIYYDEDGNKYQFLLERVPSMENAYFEYNNVKYCNGRYKTYNPDKHTFN
jgi:mannosyltransferase OCH1-like enzyme